VLGQKLFRLMRGFRGDLTGLILHRASDLRADLRGGVGDRSGPSPPPPVEDYWLPDGVVISVPVVPPAGAMS
jgi:hypothetical protein